MKKILIIILITLVMLIVLFFLLNNHIYQQKQEKETDITSFSECVEAGYPVMESYPERCMTNEGKVFINEENKKETSEELFMSSGEFVCLPFKDENKPHNDLCAFGLKNINGNYYRL